MDVFGKVLLDSYEHNTGIQYCIERNDLFIDVVDSSQYFAEYDQFNELEKKMISKIEGSVLELGAGAGRVSLYLQEKGFDVTASDNSNGALEICKRRGVNKVKELNLRHLQLDQKFGSIIIFGNTLPVVGDQEGLKSFFESCYNILEKRGKLMGSFLDPAKTEDPYHLAFHQKNREMGKPIGTMSIRVRYRHFIGDWFDFWLPEVSEFRECIDQSKWNLELYGDPYFTFLMQKI